MQFTFYPGDLSHLRADVIGVPAFEGGDDEPAARALDRALGGLLLRAARAEGFKGRAEQSFSFHTHGKIRADKVVLLGAGKSERFDFAGARDLAARAVRAGGRATRVALVVPAPARLGAAPPLPAAERQRVLLQSTCTGAALGGYRFDKYRTRDVEPVPRRRVTLCFTRALPLPRPALSRLAERGRVIAEAVAFARDLVNEPAIHLTPRALADAARGIARRFRLGCTILGPREMKKLGMGCLLGVAAGSAEEPRFIHLRYVPRKAARTVALVGKGLTFDSGGLSLKPAKSMEDMKCDMAGAAAVLAAMRIVGALRPDVAVHGIVGATENMPGGRAIRPGDVLRSMSGKTVEVLNTDAEGRLVLADAIHYARQRKPDEIIDLATLTGACMVALGRHTAGFFSNNEALAARYEEAARRAGEDAWRLPLTERLAESLRSNVADLKNIGDAYGGAITAALFLREFVGDSAWVHVDIAGPSFAEGKAPSGGATGYGVMTLAELLLG